MGVYRPDDMHSQAQPFGPTAGRFRLAMRRLAATVSIISTSENGVRHGMTATSVVSVSMEPPSLLVSINQLASIRDPLLRRRRFCVNLLSDRHKIYSEVFSGRLNGEERFSVGAWKQDEHDVPYLEDAQASISCVIAHTVEYGSHTIVIGRVLEARVAPPIEPLIHLDGNCTSLRAVAG